YVLVTEPLTPAQRAALGWERRQGAADSGNRFHYYRLTPDDRILWGGYEAIYHFRNAMAPRLEEHQPTFELLARNFAATFPQLEASASRTAGRARSTPARASASRSAARSAVGRRTPSATPDWESEPAASGHASCSTSCTTATPS
ncbi:MAG TPA: FAD-dependent oxidoreductase, partial [Thermoleophilaceae bacterium]